MRAVRFIGAVLALALASTTAFAGARDDLNTFTKGLKGLSGEFSQQVFDPQGKLKETSTGTLALATPRLFRWRGRVHRVRRGDGPERIYGEWWKRSGEADAVRDYFRVEDEEGNRFWLYRRGDSVDPRTGDLSWWLQGAFG